MTRSKSESSATDIKNAETFSNRSSKSQIIEEHVKKVKEKLRYCVAEFSGHDAKNFSSFDNFTRWMHTPTDASSLGIFRMFFGICMLIDIPEERGGGIIDVRYGEPKDCHFPLFDSVQPLPLPQMGVIYFAMWLGALGITFGYKFRTSCLMFLVPYVYIFLLNKPAWNNHSYLYGLTAFLLIFTDANKFCSVDSWNSTKEQQMVPFWNYFLIKFQFFVLYFIAGLKKMSIEWLTGYSMTNLGYHWVFAPFRIILSVEMVELLIIHWFAAIFDLTIAFWLTYRNTRIPATPFVISFHLMNSRLFSIGMFPWVCLAELPLFFNVSWSRKLWIKIKSPTEEKKTELTYHSTQEDSRNNDKDTRIDQKICRRRKRYTSEYSNLSDDNEGTNAKITPSPTCNQRFRILLIMFYCIIQFFLPYSHFITKGYNNWTNGLYGYSWDMMVHSYDTILTSVKVIDNNNMRAHYLEPYAFTDYDRWTKHADMAIQYAKCIERNLINDFNQNPKTILTSTNFSVYFDIWCSMNGRFQQRVFDPRVDLLKAKWSPFENTEWILPILNELNYMRPKLLDITNHVLSWSNHSDVLFIADFPELTIENFISPELDNVTLTVLEGAIHFEADDIDYDSNLNYECSRSIGAGQSLAVQPNNLHRITTVSKIPSCFMYTFMNKTMATMKISISLPQWSKPTLPLWKEFLERAEHYKDFFYHVGNSLLFLSYGVPMPLRVREHT